MDWQVVEVSSLSLSFSIYLPTYLSNLSIYLSVRLSTCLSASLKTKLFCKTSSGFELENIKNETILRNFLNVWTWQRQKQINSARLLRFSKLTTSKTKQFCETSSIFEFDNVKNETILREIFIFQTWQHQKRSNSARLPSKMESCVQRWRPRTNAFCDFSSPPV